MITESSSHFNNLEQMSVADLLRSINQEDKSVPLAVEKALPQIEKLVTHLVPKMQDGGRLFYIGAGTSGRLGVGDASECPPTFGVPFDRVIGLIGGGGRVVFIAAGTGGRRGGVGASECPPTFGVPFDRVIGLIAGGDSAIRKAV